MVTLMLSKMLPACLISGVISLFHVNSPVTELTAKQPSSAVEKVLHAMLLKGQSHKIFCSWLFPPNSSSWSHQICPRAVLIFLASWLSFKHFNMTPRGPMYWGGAKLYPLKNQKSPKYQGVILKCLKLSQEAKKIKTALGHI